MKYSSMHQFLNRLESGYASIDASSSPRGWLAVHMSMSSNESEQMISILTSSAESGRADLAEYQGESGKLLFEYLSARQAAAMSGKGQAIVRKGSYPHFDYVTAQELRKQIDFSTPELHAICKRAARIAGLYADADEETLLTAFLAACKPQDQALTCDYARAVGYCLGVVREASRQLRKENNQELAESITALILWTGMIVGMLAGMVILDTYGVIATLLYAAASIFLLLAADSYKEPPEDVLQAFIHDGVIIKKSQETGKRVLRYALQAPHPHIAHTVAAQENDCESKSFSSSSSSHTVYA